MTDYCIPAKSLSKLFDLVEMNYSAQYDSLQHDSLERVDKCDSDALDCVAHLRNGYSMQHHSGSSRFSIPVKYRLSNYILDIEQAVDKNRKRSGGEFVPARMFYEVSLSKRGETVFKTSSKGCSESKAQLYGKPPKGYEDFRGVVDILEMGLIEGLKSGIKLFVKGEEMVKDSAVYDAMK